MDGAMWRVDPAIRACTQLTVTIRDRGEGRPTSDRYEVVVAIRTRATLEPYAYAFRPVPEPDGGPGEVELLESEGGARGPAARAFDDLALARMAASLEWTRFRGARVPEDVQRVLEGIRKACQNAALSHFVSASQRLRRACNGGELLRVPPKLALAARAFGEALEELSR